MCFPEPHADSAPLLAPFSVTFQMQFFLLLCSCGNLSTTEAPDADMTQHDDESVRKHLNLPPSPGGDVTAECVARNQVGAFRKVFHHRMLLENTTVVYFQPHL